MKSLQQNTRVINFSKTYQDQQSRKMSSVSAKQNNLQQWLQSINCLEVFTSNDILNGMLVYNIIKNISSNLPSTFKELSASNSALSRVSNWNILSQQLKKFNIGLGQQQKNKIVNGNQDLVIQVVSQLKQFHLKKQKSSEVDIAQIDPKKDINDTKSLLQMLLVLIMKNFHLSSKQSVALLSNQSKYLAHILTKGLKGQFKAIQNFIVQMSKGIQKIVQFCKTNPQNIVFFLRSIKPALISKSQSVSSICMHFFNKYLMQYPSEQRMNIFETHLLGTYLLTIKRHMQMESEVIFGIFEGIANETSKSKEKQNKKSPLKPLMIKKVYESLNSDLQAHSMTLTIVKTFGQKNKLQEYLKYQYFARRISKVIQNTGSQQYALICIDIVIALNSYEPQLLSQQEDETNKYPNLKSKQLSYLLMQNIKQLNNSSTSCSHQISLITQFFTLLQQFGREKHFIAPSIYKLLLEKFVQLDEQQTNNFREVYNVYLANFIGIIDEFPSIPWNGILEHLINSKKSQNSPLIMTQTELQFIFFLLRNQNMDVKYSLLIYDSVSRLFMETFHLAGLIIKIMVKILQIFGKEEPIIEELSMKMIKVCLAIHNANIKKLSQKRKSLTGNNKISDEDALCRIKNNSIQFLILKTCKLDLEHINKMIEPLVAFSYIQVKDKPQLSKGFKNILNVIGNFNEIIQKYQMEIKKAEEEAKQGKEKQKQEKISREKSMSSKLTSKQHNSKIRYDEDHPQSARKQESFNQDHPGHLLPHRGQTMSLHSQNRSLNASYLGVTTSAQKGIEKFQKVYLEKIQKQDFEKIRKQQEQERFQMLKKLYKKKMMSNGIQIKGQTDQIQYLFQFDSQENAIYQKHFLKVPYFTIETQEDRDMKSVDKLLKSYQKSLKVIYSIYSGQKKGMIPQNFDEIAEKNMVISSSSLYKLLKDFYFQEHITMKEVQYLTQKVNIQINPQSVDYQFLDFEGFIEFIKQVSFLMFTRPPKDLRGQPLAMMLEETFSNIKLFAAENKINEQIFQQPSSVYFNDTEAVVELNKKLFANPDYILPEGYKKIVDKKISFEYGIILEAMSPTYKVVFEVVDQILFKALGVHTIQPFTKQQKITKARPSLFVAERIKLDVMPAKHIPIKMKKQIAKIPVTLRPIAKDCAIVLDEIIEAIQLGHTEIGLKHLNKTQLERKKRQQEQRKQDFIQKRKRESRNRQAKTAIQQYKQKKVQKQKELSVKKQDQQKKQKEEKQRKQKQEKQLKKKLEEYAIKKKGEDEEKIKKKKQQDEKDKKERERLKQMNEETKRKIQEEKKKRQQEENSKKSEKQKQDKKVKQSEKQKMQQSQLMKKKMVEDFRLRKSQVRDSSSGINKTLTKDENKSSKKNLQSYEQGED